MNDMAADSIGAETEERFTGGLRDESRAEILIPALYQALNEQTTDAIVCKRLTGSILTWNKAAEHMYGYTAEENVGKHISEIVPPDRIQELSGVLAKLHLGQRIDRYHTRRIRKGGAKLYGRRLEEVWPGQLSEGIQTLKREVLQTRQSRHGLADFSWDNARLSYEMSFVPMLDDRGEIRQILGVSRDITPLQDAHKELTTSQRKLEQNVIHRTEELQRELASLREVLAQVSTVREKVEDWTVNGKSGDSDSPNGNGHKSPARAVAGWTDWWRQMKDNFKGPVTPASV